MEQVTCKINIIYQLNFNHWKDTHYEGVASPHFFAI